ncbi:MAG: phosphoadenylyl-sulfate reductase [Rhizobiales bacterium]|nr:phosphoadenylyl-sulfate reductase [Hyphomicrobiales bacterium]
MALLEVFARPLELVDLATSHAELLARRLAPWRTRDMLDEVIHHEFPGGIALVSSFGAESSVLLHLVASVDRATPVIFVDTGKIFGSTHRYRDEIVARLGLTDVRVAKPDPAVLMVQDEGAGLWMRNPDKCCAIRKVAPLSKALSGFEAWISGRKRYQGMVRAEMPIAEADGDRVKINPLANWSKADVESYARLHDLPDHPLVADGFRSIGCMPCTSRVAEGEDDRSGRWRGSNKTECGIHLGLAAFERDGSGI